jgi:hypothetical protein
MSSYKSITSDNYLDIYIDKGVVVYNKEILKILESNFPRPNNGTIRTEKNFIKISKNQANIFDSNNEILDILQATEKISKNLITRNNQNIERFEYKAGTIILLCKENDDNFVISINYNDTPVTSEIVITNLKVGNGTNYITENENILFVSDTPSLLHSKWNGVPIGKIIEF